MFDNADYIHRYTRSDAIRDGVLMDVTPEAREAGFRYPVALTATVWARYVAVLPGVEGQHEPGRLCDILCALRHAIRQGGAGDTVHFQLYVRNDNLGPVPVTLKALCGPGDDASPCVTILLPHED